MSAPQHSSPVSTAPDPLAVEPSSSPPASPAAAAGPGTEAASLQGAAGPAPHSTAPGSPSAPSSSGSSGPVLATGGLQTAESAAAAGKLPPRLIVFNPDGQTFDIAVDKLREDQLAAAAEAAAVERRREQQRAAAAALGPGGARPAGGSRAEQQDPDVAVWRAAYARQKLLVLLSLTADVIYLIVLLILRLGWGADGGGGAPQLGTAAKFFVGSHPDTTSISFIAGTIFTDIIALYGVIQDYPSVVTLFIVWSVVLGAFAILEMPLFFMLLRLLLLVLAFQLRFSMARLHSMLPPASLAHLVATLGSRTASAGRAVWGATTRPAGGQSCGKLEAFLSGSPKFDFVAERLRKLPRRRDVTLLLPLTSVPSGSWLRAGIEPKIVTDFVKNLVLTKNYPTVEALLEEGSAETLAGTKVLFTQEDGRVYAEFEGLAGARGIVLPLPRSFKKVTVFSVANDQLVDAAAPSNNTSAPGRRLSACGCYQAYCTARVTCCGSCTSMTKDKYGLQSGVCSNSDIC
ncbi:hypothetical protein C2E21_1790 [Chlorella sorokiniana]|uniref:Uncharacterized protein n=1 Tax=Chlorella sorokiniana TaxID=3076 RepID=A0A2P6U0X3_CHLSO|nr:hypothetical protein C2E21_1790 [Chlorella sorokiniana]|eukprot:PRW59948.1 hypothetical protein C2E21_1790 [Chlorella sorokiniana]